MIHNWQFSHIIHFWEKLTKGIDENVIFEKKTVFNLILNLIIGIIGLICAIILLFVVMFVELPLKMLIYHGNIKEKVRFWFRCWKSAYEGFK